MSGFASCEAAGSWLTVEPWPELPTGLRRLSQLGERCCGFNRRAASRRGLPQNRASFTPNQGPSIAFGAWLARFYVAEENRKAHWTAGELARPALQRLAF